MQVVIVAGGGGTRLWPLSTKSRPKQFIPLVNDLTLLQYTYQLLRKKFDTNNIWISSNKKYEKIIHEQLPEFDVQRMILEPDKRDSFAAEAAATAYIASQCGDDEIVSFVPCDDYWPNRRSENNFLDALAQLEVAAANGNVALLGIKPTYPSVEYGYIELECATWRSIGQISKVVSFREKPDIATAESYLDSGKYLWHKHSPTFSYNTLVDILQAYDSESARIISDIHSQGLMSEDLFMQLPKQPIDTAVLEKTDRIVVIGVDAEWEDVGSWKTLEKYIKNSSDVFQVDAQNNLYKGFEKKVAFVGVSNILVVEGEQGLLIVDTRDASNIKKVAEHFDV